MPTSLSSNSDLVSNAQVDREGDKAVLSAKVSGEINLHNSPALRSDLLRFVEEEKPDRVVLDLGDVPYMDSSALAVLVEVLKAVRGDGGTVRLTQLQPRVRGLLQIARLDSIFELEPVDDEETAGDDAA